MQPKTPRPVIAIVDDDLHFRRALKRLVSSWDIDAETYASGSEFIDRLEETPSFSPGCVILDLQIADMHGLEVQKYLVSRGRRIPVILVTASDAATIRDNALAAGVVAVLQKPFESDLLMQTLRKILDREPFHQPAQLRLFTQQRCAT